MSVETKWYVRRCAIGVLAALFMYLLMLALCAYLTMCGIVREGEIETCVWLCALIASCAGVLLCAEKTVKHGAMTLCCATAFYLTVVLLGFLIGGTIELTGVLGLLVPVVLGAAGAIALLMKKESVRRRGRRSRRRRR